MELIALAKNPIPSGAVSGTLTSKDGVALRYARWLPTRRPLKGTICLFPGRGEFIEKYFEVIADLRRRGFGVAVLDWRGQGGSQRLLPNLHKGHVDDFADYDADLLRFMKDIVLPDCTPPYIALAHSMGGNILLRNASQPGSWFDRMVLCAPMVAFADAKVGYPHSLARLYAETLALAGGSTQYVKGGSDRPEETVSFEQNALTSDRERWARNKAVLDVAPHLGLGSPTVGWLRAAYRSCRLLQDPAYPSKVTVPMLIFSAADDTIVSTRATETFAVGLKVGLHVLVPHAKHEILQETDPIRQRFWAAFDAYLGVAPASGAAQAS